MPADAGMTANDPKSRFAELRRSIDKRFADMLEDVRDELENESPEVRAEAMFWILTRSLHSYDLTAHYLRHALSKITQGQLVEKVCGPDPARTAA